jgi:hypothetical protein
MRVEQEQRVTEDARRFSEQDAAAQRYAAQVLQVWLLFLHLVWFCFVVVGSYYIICLSKKKKKKKELLHHIPPL